MKTGFKSSLKLKSLRCPHYRSTDYYIMGPLPFSKGELKGGVKGGLREDLRGSLRVKGQGKASLNVAFWCKNEDMSLFATYCSIAAQHVVYLGMCFQNHMICGSLGSD